MSNGPGLSLRMQAAYDVWHAEREAHVKVRSIYDGQPGAAKGRG